MFTFVVVFIGAIIDVTLFGINPYTGAANSVVATLIASLALLCPFVSVASRRAHDIGQSGWLAVLTAIPYIGIVASLAFVFIPGQPDENKYGPSPKPA